MSTELAQPTETPTSQTAKELPKNYEHQAVEPRWVRRWEELGIHRYDPKSAAAAAGKTFAVDTPPPYVSAAHLHTGHAMSYSQAEFVVRYRRMRGYEIFYPMGFDDNGLPTERYVEQKYKINKGKITRKEFIDLCLKETRDGAEVYENLWRSLGLSVDWRMTYSTIQPRAVRHAQLSFLDLVQKNRLQRRKDPILWCPACTTSLAQADVEAGDEANRPMHAVRFDVDAASAPSGAPLQGVIETTRPELITACVALACHPEDPRYAAFAGLRFAVPLTNLRADADGQALPAEAHRTVPLILDDSVDPDFGTGLMMVCTFGDPEDIAKWRKHQLDTVMVLDAQGRMVTPDLPELHGKRVHVQAKGSAIYNEARLAAKELLEAHGHLQGIRDNVSRANIHERCSTPVEIQVAPQWFIQVLDLKEPLIQRGRELQWYPEFMRERYETWVENLKWDWNISRQRFYGVPFPVWFCKDCSAPNYATAAELPVDPLMSDCPRPCSECGSTALEPEPDVMDTWMTSSLTPLLNANWAMWGDEQPADLDERDKARPEIYPAGVRVQAHEIIRTWLFYTVAKSHLHTDSLPWKDVMISGWGLDRQGKKMSKRAGNFVDPAEVIGKYSADALRYWASGATLGHDLRYLEDDVKGGKRLLTKLWNSTRFALLYLQDWMPSDAAEAPTVADLWIRSRLVQVVQEATAAFDGYEYSKAVRAAEGCFWADWCDNYLEIIKDRFREGSKFSPEQIQAARNTLLQGTWTLLRLFAPVLPFITEELYHRGLQGFLGQDAPVSIHVAPWPQAEGTAQIDVFGGVVDQGALQDGQLLLALVAAVRTARTAGKIGGGRPLEDVVLTALPGATPVSAAALQAMAADAQAASRTASLRFGQAPADWPSAEAQALGVAVAILPALQEEAPVA